MQIVIEIPEDDYELVYKYPEVLFASYAKAIKNGTVLPDNALEQEPCGDAISREELLKAIDTWDKFGVDDTNSLFRLDNLSLPHYVPYIHYDDVIKCIKGMPSVTQKSGKWIDRQFQSKIDGEIRNGWECSECGERFFRYDLVNTDEFIPKYCPNCGAKMESEDKE